MTMTPTAVPSTASQPPIPNRTTKIAPPTAAVKTRDNITLTIFAAIVFAIAGAFYWNGHPVPAYCLGAFGALLLVSLFTRKSDVGQCPFCMNQFRVTIAVSKDGLLRCDHCGEYSEILDKIVKPLDPSTYSESPKFESPMFQQGSMPNACVACGAPATRIDTVTKSSLNKTLAVASAARLVSGTPGLAVFRNKQASITVPYCDQHKDKLLLHFDWRKRPVLTWCSLAMMRRYLAVNRGKQKY